MIENLDRFKPINDLADPALAIVLHFFALVPSPKECPSPKGPAMGPGETMHWRAQQLIAREAMQFHRDGNNAEAARLLRQLIEDGCRDPKVLSYGGLLVATQQDDVKTGLAWCERAIEMAFYDAQMYINLARLHEHSGWKTQAAQVLRKGLRIDPGNEKLLVEINRVSPRTPDAEPALPRDHVINRTIGKMRAKDKVKPAIKPKTSPSYS